jgi:hypothetical protein
VDRIADPPPEYHGVQAVCSCGWRSSVFGTDKTAGTRDALIPE